MTKPVFFIDGFMELKILQRLGINTMIRRIDCNGKGVKIVTIIKKILPLIQLIKDDRVPLIIIIDRERRRETPSQIIKDIETNIRKECIKNPLYIGISDQMIENWIIADWDNFTKYIKKRLSRPKIQLDGKNGYKIIKRVFHNYNKCTDGVELFVTAKASIMRTNSMSFCAFYNKIFPLYRSCPWINH